MASVVEVFRDLEIGKKYLYTKDPTKVTRLHIPNYSCKYTTPLENLAYGGIYIRTEVGPGSPDYRSQTAVFKNQYDVEIKVELDYEGKMCFIETKDFMKLL